MSSRVESPEERWNVALSGRHRVLLDLVADALKLLVLLAVLVDGWYST